MKKKVGLLVDSLQVSKQIKDFIDMSLTSNNYEISTIIVNDSSILSELPRKKIFKYIQRKGFSKFINKVFFIILYRLEKKIISRKLIYKNFYNNYKLAENDFDVIRVSPIISKSGLSCTYDDSDLEKIKSANLQLLVRGGRGILRGKILTCCPNGIISFHHADKM